MSAVVRAVVLHRAARKLYHPNWAVGIRREDSVEPDYVIVMWMCEHHGTCTDAARAEELDGWHKRRVALWDTKRVDDQPSVIWSADDNGFAEAGAEYNEVKEIRLERRREVSDWHYATSGSRYRSG
jgi:hypothetical protein